MKGYIYKTTNSLNNKIYIGKKTSEYFLSDYYGSGVLIQGALLKYGRENFRVELLESIDDLTDLDNREQYWISFYNSTSPEVGYNISRGGVSNDFLSKTSSARTDDEYVELRQLVGQHRKKKSKQQLKQPLEIKVISDEELLYGTKKYFRLTKKYCADVRYDSRSIVVMNKKDVMIEVPHFVVEEYERSGWRVGYLNK